MAIYLFTYFIAFKSSAYHFDAQGRPGAFEPHARRYQDLARLIIGLSAVSVGYLVNFLVNISPNGQLRSTYSLALESASATAISYLCVSILLGILFVLAQSYFYEEYVHSTCRETYRRWKYSLSMSLAFTGLFCFVAAFLKVAWRILG